jgi:glycosyl hydrolase family 106( putative alpha-L-rhamnosidase)
MLLKPTAVCSPLTARRFQSRCWLLAARRFQCRSLESLRSLGMTALVALAISAVAPAPARAQSPAWPAITNEMRPWTRWWWQGSAVDSADLKANLDAYRRVGLGGVELTPIYGVRGGEKEFIPYLSPRWVGMLEYTLTEAKELGLGVDMNNGTGWPFGGPNVGDADAAKYVAWKSYTVHGGERLRDTVAMIQSPLVRAVNGRVDISQLRDPIASTPNLQALAIDQVRFPKPMPLVALVAYPRSGTPIDVTAHVTPAGILDWTAPAGDWTLYAVFQGWHGKQVERAAPGGEGNALDHFAREPITHYLQRFDNAFAGRNVSGVRAFFNDSYEVDDAQGQGDWTPRLFDEFRARRGYDLRNYLPFLMAAVESDSSRRVLSDYRQTVSDLMLDGFTTTWGAWARARGAVIRNQAHGSPANILDLYAASDIPETEGTDPTRIRFATSAAHVAGKRLASAEAATWLTEHFVTKLSDVRAALDNYFLNGVNHVVYHGSAYSPVHEEWPGRLFYAAVEFNPQNPWWRDFAELNSYVARVQSFLQSGEPDNDVLLYFPIFDRFAQPSRVATALLEHFDAIPPSDSSAFRLAADLMLPRGYAYDYVSDRQLAGVKVEDAALVSQGGSRYRTVLVPATHYMPIETMEHLVRLARAGATIAFYRGLPADVAGLHDLEGHRTRLRAIIAELKFTPSADGAVKRAPLGRGAVLVGDDLASLLGAAGARHEPAAALDIQLTRRRERDGYTYFIVNTSGRTVDGWVPLATTAKSAVVYAAMHAQAGLGRIREVGNGIEVYLQFPASASRIVRTYDHEVSDTSWPYTETAGAPATLRGGWLIDFIAGGPNLPAQVRNAPLGSWTELPGDDMKKFSGTARYSISFQRPVTPEGATSWRLDLGTVRESARVVFNGTDLGTFIGPWFRVEVQESLLKDTNTLEVEVTNLMANRIADLDRRGVLWKKFYNTNFPPRLAANRGPDGLFTAAQWTPLPSGLIGPVTLTPLRPKRF